jgi:hypothetical protein
MSTMQIAMKMALIRRMKPIPGQTLGHPPADPIRSPGHQCP